MKKYILFLLLVFSLVYSLSFASAASINSAYWSYHQNDQITSSYHGYMVYACATTSGYENGGAISFEIYEHDTTSGDDYVNTFSTTISNNFACVQWVVNYQDDGWAGDPEFYFKASAGGNSKWSVDLSVPAPAIDAAYWASDLAGNNRITNANDGSAVYMCINTKDRSIDSAKLDIYEDDTFGDDYIRTEYSYLDNNGKTCKQWIVEWVDDGAGSGNEFYFESMITPAGIPFTKTSNTLNVPAPYKRTIMTCYDKTANIGSTMQLESKLEEDGFWSDPDLQGQPVNFWINNQHIGFATTDSSGIGKKDYTPQTVGTYTIKSTFSPTSDSIYGASECTSVLTVKDPSKRDTAVTAYDKIGVANIEIRIEAILKESGSSLANQRLSLYIDNSLISINTTASNGKTGFYYTPATSKKYTILVKFDGDSNYNPSQDTAILDIRPAGTCLGETDNPHVVNKCVSKAAVTYEDRCFEGTENGYITYSCGSDNNCQAAEKTCPSNELCSWGKCIAKCSVVGQQKCEGSKSMVCTENGLWKEAECTQGCDSSGLCKAETDLGRVLDTDANNPLGDLSPSVCVDGTGKYYDECGCFVDGNFYSSTDERCRGNQTGYLNYYNKDSATNKCISSIKFCESGVCENGRCIPGEELPAASDLLKPKIDSIQTTPSSPDSLQFTNLTVTASDDIGVQTIIISIQYPPEIDSARSFHTLKTCISLPGDLIEGCSYDDTAWFAGQNTVRAEVIDRVGKITTLEKTVNVAEVCRVNIEGGGITGAAIRGITGAVCLNDAFSITPQAFSDSMRSSFCIDVRCCKKKTSNPSKADCIQASASYSFGNKNICDAINTCEQATDVVFGDNVGYDSLRCERKDNTDLDVWFPGAPTGTPQLCLPLETQPSPTPSTPAQESKQPVEIVRYTPYTPKSTKPTGYEYVVHINLQVDGKIIPQNPTLWLWNGLYDRTNGEYENCFNKYANEWKVNELTKTVNGQEKVFLQAWKFPITTSGGITELKKRIIINVPAGGSYSDPRTEIYCASIDRNGDNKITNAVVNNVKESNYIAGRNLRYAGAGNMLGG